MNDTNGTMPCATRKPLTAEEIRELHKSSDRGILIFLAVIMFFLISVLVCQYLSCYFASKKSRRVTRVPKMPINDKKLILYTGSRFSENKTPEARIFLSGPVNFKNNGSWKLDRILKMIFSMTGTKGNLVPWGTKIISIKMDGFKHGTSCTDFEPIDGTLPGSYYTYQIYGQSIIQVTRYVIGQLEYVAGFCIYNEFTERSQNDERKIEWVDININVIKRLMASPKYPGRSVLEQKVKDQAKEAPQSASLTGAPAAQPKPSIRA